MPFVQGAMFVSISAGTSLARDIETGFLNRLALTPLRTEAMLIGQLGGASVARRACRPSCTCSWASPPGSTSPAGRVGSRCCCCCRWRSRSASRRSAGCWRCGWVAAKRSRAIFPLLFVTLFLSSSSLPRNLIQTTWFREVATYNPVSYLLEGLRSLVIQGWNAQALELAFGFALALAAISLALSGPAMKSRLARR